MKRFKILRQFLRFMINVENVKIVPRQLIYNKNKLINHPESFRGIYRKFKRKYPEVPVKSWLSHRKGD